MPQPITAIRIRLLAPWMPAPDSGLAAAIVNAPAESFKNLRLLAMAVLLGLNTVMH